MNIHMRKLITAVAALSAAFYSTTAFADWKPVGDKIKTAWAEKVSPQNALPEYPRPIMERAQWLNLNGLWDYAITAKDAPRPDKFDGQILVPFAVESSLSGVGKMLGENKSLWYERSIEIPADWKGKNILLNFGAVDWKAEVFVNGAKIGEHTGGYTPFSFDITKSLKDGKNTLAVRVWDSTGGTLPHGKQSPKPERIFYTSVSGIWQTVWLEPVCATHISKLKITPDLDSSSFAITVSSADEKAVANIKILDKGKVVAEAVAPANKVANIPVVNPKLWSPKSPFLYDLEISLSKDGQKVDEVKSYAGMRKFAIKKLSKWANREFQLNNRKFFSFGLLDQGYWPDGLYTAPTDEALRFDIQKTKDFGFNSIRKHIKVEPARWYTYCDRMGIVVWQDMPAQFAGEYKQWQPRSYFKGETQNPNEWAVRNYKKEWKEIIESLESYPCIAMWVPFNENWGQFDTAEIAEWTKQLDPTRLVNAASGGNFFDCGDVFDTHDYGRPTMALFDGNKLNVIGEYGGINCRIKGHEWDGGNNWGYGKSRTPEKATEAFIDLTNHFIKMAEFGCQGAIYTQTTDVELETNGIMTYDRKVIKLDEKKVREANLKLSNVFDK